MILDSTILIDFLKNDENAIKKIQEIEKTTRVLATTVISVFEILQGIRHTGDLQKEREINGLFDRLSIFPFGFEEAKEAAKIRSGLLARGITIEPTDCMIAGVAKLHNEIILTRNVKHFSKISEVQVLTY